MTDVAGSRLRNVLRATAGWNGRWSPDPRSVTLDIAVALLATGVELGLLFEGSRGVSPLAILLTVLAGATLVARRRAPLAVLAATIAAELAVVAVGDYPGGAPILLALYTTAEIHDWRVSLAALVPTVLVLAIGEMVSPPPTVAIWAIGAYAHTRRRYTLALEQRADDLEREREQLARIAVHEERASIARELHDIVAHSVSVMLIGVRGARDVLRTAPDVADDTLGRVETSGEQSLAELRRILALLREAEHGAESRPQPSLARLDELVSGYRDAGLPVTLEVTGQRQPLPAGIELSAYRIVQEALTNVLKHSHPTRVTVTLSYQGSRLDIDVVDDGTTNGPEPDTAAHGLLGMRERVALLGGELETGRRAGGGFRVAARLPVGGDA
jgi:signal transduction histidine kinase